MTLSRLDRDVLEYCASRETFPTRSQIADRLGCSMKAVTKSLRHLNATRKIKWGVGLGPASRVLDRGAA